MSCRFFIHLSLPASIPLSTPTILSICPPIYRGYLCLSVWLSVCFSAVCEFFYLPNYLHICLSVYSFIYLSIFVCVYLSLYVSLHLSVYLFIYLFVSVPTVYLYVWFTFYCSSGFLKRFIFEPLKPYIYTYFVSGFCIPHPYNSLSLDCLHLSCTVSIHEVTPLI